MKKLRFIDNSGPFGKGLVIGEIYTIRHESQFSVFLKECVIGYNKDRFEEVKEKEGFRCIIFGKLLTESIYLRSAFVFQSSQGEGETLEKAMTACLSPITFSQDLTEHRLTWQPSSGKVFLEETEIGVVYRIMMSE